MRTVQFEGQLLILPLHPHLPYPCVSSPPAPPRPSRTLCAVFLLPLSTPVLQAPAAHPLCLGWRHTSSTPPQLKSPLPPFSLPPVRPQPRVRMPACHPPSLLERRLLLRAAQLQASPHQGGRPARLASAEVSASGCRPGFPCPPAHRQRCCPLAPLPLLWAGWWAGGVPVPVLRRPACGCSPSHFPSYSPFLARGGVPALSICILAPGL